MRFFKKSVSKKKPRKNRTRKTKIKKTSRKTTRKRNNSSKSKRQTKKGRKKSKKKIVKMIGGVNIHKSKSVTDYPNLPKLKKTGDFYVKELIDPGNSEKKVFILVYLSEDGGYINNKRIEKEVYLKDSPNLRFNNLDELIKHYQKYNLPNHNFTLKKEVVDA